ncbi:MAG: 30S ribosomal protein S7 [Candidatus Micrarchaeota archaeon]|nr:30S ribosomal protein S7 [Candidatus Micrarchaeota archaeon]MDE1824185.1 30S ribosomal protein S7 [Candidatus Micrarchaeota archaeon]MDE1849435.1 30S ribosomal protein S7 [Candidatus Micrarchaeota archaeon]
MADAETNDMKEEAAAETQQEAQPASQEQEEKRTRRQVQKKTASLSVKEQLLFEKYSINDVKVNDQSLAGYILFTKRAYPNIFGRRKFQSYYKSHISVIERLMNKLMRGGTGKKIGGRVIRTEGRLQGKKLKVMHVVEEAFDIISNQTKKNPVQVFVEALENSAPIEDTTRVRYGGISYNVAVGISSQRRLDVAIRNVATASLMGAFQNRKSLAEALASEIITASNNSPDSYAIKKRQEAERIAKRAR